MIIKITQTDGDVTYIGEGQIISIETSEKYGLPFKEVWYDKRDVGKQREEVFMDGVTGIGYPYFLENGETVKVELDKIERSISDIQSTISRKLEDQNKLLEIISYYFNKKNLDDYHG